MHKKIKYSALAMILVMLVSLLSISTLAQTPSPVQSESDLPASSGPGGEEPDWQVNYHLGTQEVRFLNTKSGAPIPQPGFLRADGVGSGADQEVESAGKIPSLR